MGRRDRLREPRRPIGHAALDARRDCTDESGRTGGLVAIYRDITASKAAEDALRESEKRLRFALEGANEGLWDWSIDTGDVYFSAAAELMLGYEPGEMERRAGRHVGSEPPPR